MPYSPEQLVKWHDQVKTQIFSYLDEVRKSVEAISARATTQFQNDHEQDMALVYFGDLMKDVQHLASKADEYVEGVNEAREAGIESQQAEPPIATASGYNHPNLPGRFFKSQGELRKALKKVAKGGGASGMAKSIKGEEHPHAACMDKVRRHKIDVDDPEAFCAEAVDIAKGTTHWRGKEEKKEKD